MYTYVYKKQTWPEVKATYRVVQEIMLVKTITKLKSHAFSNHLNH